MVTATPRRWGCALTIIEITLTKMEDAVTFLETAKDVYADVTLLLSKTQLLALDKDPNEPFSETVLLTVRCQYFACS